jgi:hypothetical protein
MRWIAPVVVAAAFCGLPLAAADAQFDETAILGHWQIVAAAPAPWTDEAERKALTAAGKRLLKLAITFNATNMRSKFKLFDCRRRVSYEAVDLPVDTLFQGNLPEPNPVAAASRLGFPRGDVPSVDVRCINASFTFHFRDRDTLLTALDNVIYTLKRQP